MNFTDFLDNILQEKLHIPDYTFPESDIIVGERDFTYRFDSNNETHDGIVVKFTKCSPSPPWLGEEGMKNVYVNKKGNTDMYEIGFAVESPYNKFAPISDDATYRGDARNILGKVIKATKDFIDKYHPIILMAGAKTPSKVKAYRFILNTFAKEQGYYIYEYKWRDRLLFYMVFPNPQGEYSIKFYDYVRDYVKIH